MKTYVLITIDTESGPYKDKYLLLEKMIYGVVGGSKYGIDKIMDMCDAHNFQATFFVDVYSHVHFGKERIKEVCQHIKNKGHDVQLHTHPRWLKGKRSMWEYTAREQDELIEEGVELIEQWTGEAPVAHRAGGYGADETTLKSLNKHNVKFDSSFYVNFPYCRLTSPPLALNAIRKLHEVIEIPVSVFKEFHFGPFKKYRSVDINASSLSELKYAISSLCREGTHSAILFLHSFSFLKRSKDRSIFKPDERVVRKFEKLLDYFDKQKNIEVVSFKQLNEIMKDNKLSDSQADYVPTSGAFRTLLRIILHFNYSWKNRLFVIFSVIIMVVLMGLFLI